MNNIQEITPEIINKKLTNLSPHSLKIINQIIDSINNINIDNYILNDFKHFFKKNACEYMEADGTFNRQTIRCVLYTYPTLNDNHILLNTLIDSGFMDRYLEINKNE